MRGIDAVAKIEDAFERTTSLSFLGQSIADGFAAPFDRRETEENLAIVDSELSARGIDARLLDRDPHPLAVLEVLDQWIFAFEISVCDIPGQQSSHEFHFEVGFEISGLVGDKCVGCRVAFIKTVACKFQNLIPEVFGILFRQTQIDGPLEKFLLVGRDDRLLLLADRLDARVGFGQFDPTESVEDPHDLLLVNHHTVGFLEDFLEHRVQVGSGFFLELDGDVLVDHPPFERSWTVQGVGGDDVAKMVGFHALEQIADTSAFQLKDPFGFPASEQFEGLLVIERELHRIDMDASGFFDHLDGFREDRQVPKSQEVHFQEACGFDVTHRPLGDHVVLARASHQRDVFGQGFIGDDDSGRVGSDISSHPLDSLRKVEHFADLWVQRCLSQILARFDGFLEGGLTVLWNHLADFRDTVQGNIDGPTDVLDGPSGFEGAESSDLCDVVLAVFVFDIANDFSAPILTKIDVDIRGFQPALVEEAFEEQIVLDGAHVGQIQRIADQGTDTATAGGCWDSDFASVADKVPNDKKIVGKTEFLDHAQFAVQAVQDDLGQLPLGDHLRIPFVALEESLDA